MAILHVFACQAIPQKEEEKRKAEEETRGPKGPKSLICVIVLIVCVMVIKLQSSN